MKNTLTKSENLKSNKKQIKRNHDEESWWFIISFKKKNE